MGLIYPNSQFLSASLLQYIINNEDSYLGAEQDFEQFPDAK